MPNDNNNDVRRENNNNNNYNNINIVHLHGLQTSDD